MDIALLILGFIFMLVGILGSFFACVTRPTYQLDWPFIIVFNQGYPLDWWFLGITLGIALLVLVMDYIIPAIGTKKFGGSKSGMVGTTLGLVVALVFPILGIFGLLFGLL